MLCNARGPRDEEAVRKLRHWRHLQGEGIEGCGDNFLCFLKIIVLFRSSKLLALQQRRHQCISVLDRSSATRQFREVIRSVVCTGARERCAVMSAVKADVYFGTGKSLCSYTVFVLRDSL